MKFFHKKDICKRVMRMFIAVIMVFAMFAANLPGSFLTVKAAVGGYVGDFGSHVSRDWSVNRGGHDELVENDMYWLSDAELYQNCTWNYYSEEKIIYMINKGRLLDYVQLLKDGGWIPQDFVPSGNASGSSNTATTPSKEYSEEEIANAWKETSRTESTCAVAGKITYKNSITGKTKTEELPLLEHSYEETAEEEPTCVFKGTRTYTCLGCGDSYTESIPMIDHDYQVLNVVESTCTEDGIVTYTCTMCSDSYEEVALATGHTTDEWEVTKDATLFGAGINSLICMVCNKTVDTEVIPAICPIPLWGVILIGVTLAGVVVLVVVLLKKKKSK